jgi:hypothetical protein
MLRPRTLLLAAALATVALPAFAQREIVGGEDDEDGDAPPRKAEEPPADDKKAEDPKKKKKQTAEEKKAEDKKAEDKKAEDKKDPKKAEDKKAEDPKKAVDAKKGAPVDVLADTDDDKKKRKAEDDARKKAEESASVADKKKAEDKAKLAEEKRLNEEKRREDTKVQRLASAKRERTYRRVEGDVTVLAELTPGAVQKNGLVELRLDVFKRLDVADPKFGNREPFRDLRLVAVVVEQTGKKDARTSYAVHSLGAPGRYGFHFTPVHDGVVQVLLTGEVSERTINMAIPLHVGVWPPPDFDEEDKKLAGQ